MKLDYMENEKIYTIYITKIEFGFSQCLIRIPNNKQKQKLKSAILKIYD